MIPLAVIGSAIIGLILLFFVNRKPGKNPYIIVLSCINHEVEKQAMDFINSTVERCVVKSKSAQNGLVEINMEVRLKDDNTDFISDVAAINGVNSAVLVSYNGEYMN